MVNIKSLIPITIVYTAAVIFFINYVLLKNFKIFPNVPDFFMHIIFSSIFFFCYGYYISYSASVDKCDKVDKKQSSIHAFKSVIYVVLTYILIYLFLPIRQPFIELLGDNILSSTVTETFFISLNLIISVINNYFDAAKNICRVTPKQLEKNLRKLDKYLNKKDTKVRGRRIIVKD